MSRVTTATSLFVLLVLSRALGQNALSIVSLTLPGQWFARRLSRAMAIYSIALSIGFMAAFPIIGHVVTSQGWRPAWASVGWCLVVIVAPLGWLLVRNAPSAGVLTREGETHAPGRD